MSNDYSNKLIIFYRWCMRSLCWFSSRFLPHTPLLVFLIFYIGFWRFIDNQWSEYNDKYVWDLRKSIVRVEAFVVLGDKESLTINFYFVLWFFLGFFRLDSHKLHCYCLWFEGRIFFSLVLHLSLHFFCSFSLFFFYSIVFTFFF